MAIKLPRSEELEVIISAREPKSHRSLARAFGEKNKTDPNKGWDLLADIFDFHFQSSNPNEPFGPKLQMDGKRSLIPDDLTDEQLDALTGILEGIADPEFQARITDVLWLCRRDAKAGRRAVKAYIEFGILVEDPKHWVTSMECYERAARLARILGRRSPEFSCVLNHLLERVRFYDGQDDSWFTHHGLSLLLDFRSGEPVELAALATKIAKRASAEKDFRRAGEHYELVSKFHRRAGDDIKENVAMRDRAECLVDQAEAHEANGSFLAAHSFWNEAIQAYRRVSKSGERIRELHQRLNTAGEKMRDEMKPVGTEIDLSEQVKHAQELLQDENLHDAICIFCGILVLPIDPSALRTQAEDTIEEHPIQATVSVSVYDAAGRKVDERPPAFTEDSEQREKAVLGFMDQHAGYYRQVCGAGSLAEAMRQIVAKHIVDEESIASLIKDSPFIPKGRLSMFLRGIRFGFEWDFSTALHILVPQLENALRALLAQHSVITTSLDAVGIEEDWPLGRILGDLTMPKILGEDQVYELRSLLLGQPGSNIRNLLAHGLLDDDHLSGPQALYLWWLILRLVVIPTKYFKSFVRNLPKN